MEIKEILELFLEVSIMGVFIFLYTGKLRDNLIFNISVAVLFLVFITYQFLKAPSVGFGKHFSSLFLLIALGLHFYRRILPQIRKS